MKRVEEVDDIPLQVVENTGVAGDVILLHPLTLHVARPKQRRRASLPAQRRRHDRYAWLGRVSAAVAFRPTVSRMPLSQPLSGRPSPVAFQASVCLPDCWTGFPGWQPDHVRSR
jgi:hypothetical protein